MFGIAKNLSQKSDIVIDTHTDKVADTQIVIRKEKIIVILGCHVSRLEISTPQSVKTRNVGVTKQSRFDEMSAPAKIGATTNQEINKQKRTPLL